MYTNAEWAIKVLISKYSKNIASGIADDVLYPLCHAIVLSKSCGKEMNKEKFNESCIQNYDDNYITASILQNLIINKEYEDEIKKEFPYDFEDIIDKAKIMEQPNPDEYKIFEKSIKKAIKVHAGQNRKGNSEENYITHPMTVAIILAQYGKSDEVINAGILHDTVEMIKDSPEASLIESSLRQVSEEFGIEVGRLVRGATEKRSKKNYSWEERKMDKIEYLKTAPLEEKFVVAADDISNLIDSQNDIMNMGEEEFWSKFNATKEEKEWYYREKYKCFVADLKEEEPIFDRVKIELEATFSQQEL